MLRAYFAVASRLLPDLARRQAERLFTLPPRYAGRRTQSVDARRETVVAGKHSLAVWQAGPPAAPAVLLVHGWGGRGVQMGSFVAPLLAAAIASYGSISRDMAKAVADRSRCRTSCARGGARRHARAVRGGDRSFARRGGDRLRDASRSQLGRVVFVSPPASIDEHAHNFARLLGITPGIRDAMRQRLERRYGVRFAEIDRIDELEQLRLPALFVHDSGDAEVPFEHALRLSARMPGARLIKTYGLGHHRLLREPGVVGAIVDFVRGRRDDLPAELPMLPRPAPIY